jgi:predicted dehydrogenase
MNRRDTLKGLAAVPILSTYVLSVFAKQKESERSFFDFLKDFELEHPIMEKKTLPVKTGSSGSKVIRLGLIGYGIRGKQLAKSAGFVYPQTLEEYKLAAEKDRNDKRYKTIIDQEDFNIVFNGICDLYEPYSEMGALALANREKKTKSEFKGNPVKRFVNYKDLIHSPDIDAVIIATPDFWHAEMIIEAAKAGKHVYCEKCMTHTLEEVYDVRKVVKETGIVFQLGHQNRQSASYVKASQLMDNNVLGSVSLIETSTNRNSPSGAWVYDIPAEASEKNVDWKQFLKPGMNIPFSKEQFFRWRCWWDYGTGLSGDMLTHEFDCMNQVMKLGIPERVMASGGIYYFKDGRNVPDVFNVLLEYPKRSMTMMYSATLGSSRPRKRLLMGSDAVMELGGDIVMYVEPDSKRYAKLVEAGKIKPELPFVNWQPGSSQIDAMTSATQKYFASRGLMYTMQNGKLTDTTFLHIKEWVDCIRDKTTPSCNIDQGFQEAITAHMSVKSYKENRAVIWDSEKEKIV